MQKLLRTPNDEEGWFELARQLIRTHMTLRQYRFEDLRQALARLGIDEPEVNLRNRIGRGHFSAAFMLQCLRAMEIGELVLPIDDVDDARKPK